MPGSIRPGDLAARTGGDEFMLLLDHADFATARTVAERLIEAFTATVSAGSTPATLSIGVADSRNAQSLDELLGSADHALYNAKRQGGNQTASADAAPATGPRPSVAADAGRART